MQLYHYVVHVLTCIDTIVIDCLQTIPITKVLAITIETSHYE